MSTSGVTKTVAELVDSLRYRPVATNAAQMREAADLIERLQRQVDAAALLATTADKFLGVIHSQLADGCCTCGEKANDDYTDCDWHQAFDAGIACRDALGQFNAAGATP